MRDEIIVGIDPDCEKSGVCVIDKRFDSLNAQQLTFSELVDLFNRLANSEDSTRTKIIIEAGWMNESNWHIHGKSVAVAAKIGNSTGRNHETARKLAEMSKFYGLNTQEIRPLKKSWKGRDGKITHEELAKFTRGLIPKRTSQDVRDAILIAWIYAGYSIRY